MTKPSLMRFAGFVWFLIGLFLMTLGMKFLITVLKHPTPIYFSTHFSLLKLFASTSHQTVILWTILGGLTLGYFKGRFVLRKTVMRQASRIKAMSKPSLRQIYGPGYYLLMACMIGLGFSMRYLPITLEVRGAIDVTIGSALLQGALHYFRLGAAFQQERIS